MLNTLKDKLFSNPAQKWLYVSCLGLAMCLVSLGMHVSGAGNTSQPLPGKVMSQVFGFTPYYFEKDSPPGKLSLKSDTAKFLGNTLSYELVKSPKETVKISEMTMPTSFDASKTDGSITFDIPEGKVFLDKPKDGKISGSLLTKDKTLITAEAPDSLNPDILEDVLRSFIPTTKPNLTNP